MVDGFSWLFWFFPLFLFFLLFANKKKAFLGVVGVASFVGDVGFFESIVEEEEVFVAMDNFKGGIFVRISSE